MRQLIGLLVEFSIAPLRLAKNDRNRFRRAFHLGFKQLMHALAGRIIALGGIPLGQKLPAFRLCQQRHLLDRLSRVSQNPGDQLPEVIDHAANRRPLEQIRIVFDHPPKIPASLLLRFTHEHGEVKLSGHGCRGKRRHGQVT